MNSTTYIVIGGGVLALVLAIALFFLMKKKKRRGRRSSGEGKRRSTEKGERKGGNPPSSETVKEEEPGLSSLDLELEKSLKEERKRKAAAAPRGTESLPVIREPMEEMPGIDRGDFSRFSDRQILIVEDNKINQKLILTLLGDSKMGLDTAEDGVEALEKLRAPGAHYDLVLMDVNMPRMDGLQATREIREDERLREIPVVALTASTTPEEVEAILESGMNAYLDKPIVLGKLYRAFEIFFSRKPAVKEERPQSPSPSPSVSIEAVEIDPNHLNTQEGLERCNDDADLYAMLLEDFLVNYEDAERQLEEWAKEGATASIRSMMVDLEGIAGTLGAGVLYEAALHIHREIEKGGEESLAPAIKDFGMEMALLRGMIRSYLDAR